MSWSISVSGHEDEGPNPPAAEKLEAVAAAAVAEAQAQGLHPIYASPGGAVSYDAAATAENAADPDEDAAETKKEPD